jgi:hypothetical protein
MFPSVTIFTRGFNTTVLHVTVLKYVNGCPKITLVAGLVMDVKLHFPGPHAHLTSIPSMMCSSVGTFENLGLYQYCSYWRGRVASNSTP